MKLFCLIEAAKGDEMGLLGGWVDREVKRECGDDGWCKSPSTAARIVLAHHVIQPITYAHS
jgi:hypothetical protein